MTMMGIEVEMAGGSSASLHDTDIGNFLKYRSCRAESVGSCTVEVVPHVIS